MRRTSPVAIVTDRAELALAIDRRAGPASPARRARGARATSDGDVELEAHVAVQDQERLVAVEQRARAADAAAAAAQLGLDSQSIGIGRVAQRARRLSGWAWALTTTRVDACPRELCAPAARITGTSSTGSAGFAQRARERRHARAESRPRASSPSRGRAPRARLGRISARRRERGRQRGQRAQHRRARARDVRPRSEGHPFASTTHAEAPEVLALPLDDQQRERGRVAAPRRARCQ